MTPIGEIASLYRYPIKSMRGEGVERVDAGWHGLAGDRRLGLRKTLDRGGFPRLTASTLPELLLFTPERPQGHGADELPAVVRSPAGETLPVFGPALAEAIGREDGWVGGVLSFGDPKAGAAVVVTMLDERCAMVNYDPDSARADPAMLRTIVRDRDNNAGVYGAVVRRGSLAVGQPVFFEPLAGWR